MLLRLAYLERSQERDHRCLNKWPMMGLFVATTNLWRMSVSHVGVDENIHVCWQHLDTKLADWAKV
jgi:hypothetical protein